MFALTARGSSLTRFRPRLGLVFSRGKRKESKQDNHQNTSASFHVFKKFKNSSRNFQQDTPTNPNAVFKPVSVKPNPDDINLGEVNEEIAGKINKQALLKKLNVFYRKDVIIALSKEHGLDDYLYHQAFISFRKYCMEVKYLPTDLYVLFSDILQGSGNIDDIFPYFLKHARKVFPHLDCLDELKLISDLSDPARWYVNARNMNRKVIFHAGPTNSGKTYHALERFFSAKSGVYCGPLKLLAVEVFNKSNARGVPCDLVTGEERKYAREDGESSSHVSCTVEMTNCNETYEVAVIDEIQMVKDYQRGWAWTRALLGIPAEEIHVCGEASAIDLVREIMLSTGEDLDVHTYRRLTKLELMDKAIESLENVQPGDCIVCFNKQDIYNVSRTLDRLGIDCAVIYGSLPPITKLAMANKFNDPSDPCKVLVATDAIGMGLNLNIRRIIFYSLTKLHLTETGEREMDVITVSQALQIAGRAGRFNTQWETGFVTCFKQEEISILKDLLSKQPEDILHAGLHPTFDQIEMYAYHLPHATLSNLLDIFVSLSTLDDSLYKLCQFEDFKFLANMIEHIQMPLKARYVFCCAPINRKMPFVCTMFLKIVRQYSKGELVTFDWLCHQVGWPFAPPQTILDLIHLEAVHDVFDLYLWLSYRFQDAFPDSETVRSIQVELDHVLQEGVSNIVQLLKNSESGVSTNSSQFDDDSFEAKNRQNARYRNKWTHEDKEISARQGPFSKFATDAKLKNQDGSLGDQLVSQGILTNKMMSQLRREWEDKMRGKRRKNDADENMD